MARDLKWRRAMKRSNVIKKASTRKAPQARQTTPREPDEVRFGEREREYVFSVAMKYVKDEDEAADVAQEAMLLAYRHRASFRGDSRFTTWLYRVAATTALMHLRKDRRLPLLHSIDADEPSFEEPSDDEATPEDQWASSEAVQIAGERLAEL